MLFIHLWHQFSSQGFTNKTIELECSSVIAYLPSMCCALGSIPTTSRKEQDHRVWMA
jgi:hypothetical protein